jgi:hypothetical protein
MDMSWLTKMWPLPADPQVQRRHPTPSSFQNAPIIALMHYDYANARRARRRTAQLTPSRSSAVHQSNPTTQLRQYLLKVRASTATEPHRRRFRHWAAFIRAAVRSRQPPVCLFASHSASVRNMSNKARSVLWRRSPLAAWSIAKPRSSQRASNPALAMRSRWLGGQARSVGAAEGDAARGRRRRRRRCAVREETGLLTRIVAESGDRIHLPAQGVRYRKRCTS